MLWQWCLEKTTLSRYLQLNLFPTLLFTPLLRNSVYSSVSTKLLTNQWDVWMYCSGHRNTDTYTSANSSRARWYFKYSASPKTWNIKQGLSTGDSAAKVTAELRVSRWKELCNCDQWFIFYSIQMNVKSIHWLLMRESIDFWMSTHQSTISISGPKQNLNNNTQKHSKPIPQTNRPIGTRTPRLHTPVPWRALS